MDCNVACFNSDIPGAFGIGIGTVDGIFGTVSACCQ
ncbi:MAG: hypothetical protein IBGAMO2_130015 [Arenicellales bacterium IbO2]|nr:MAG: hypothetical protein IBGAMO2_130015 [Arenicellales bacterium IbO2]